jgi:DNA ligase (NAD+)
MSTIQSLNQQLEAARRAYYAGHPVMSDAAYDVLEQQLAGLHTSQPSSSQPSVLFVVGSEGSGRIPHKYPMRSIENTYTEDELLAFFREHAGPFTLSSKWDGVSCSLDYKDGELVQALTRGDGDAGEDILPQVRACIAIPQSLPGWEDVIPAELNVRGELLISQSTLVRLNLEQVARGGKPYSSTRNLVAGAMKLKDLDEVTARNVEFAPWEVVGDGLPDSALERIHLLATWFRRPDDRLIKHESELLNDLRISIANLTRDKQEYGRDGFVLKVDNVQSREKLGLGSKYANFQVAFKPQNAKTESVLREVIWQVGRQGRLTPVGRIDPVVLAGATIERVTLNNATWILEMGLKIGSRIVIMRSGDVIPKLVEVLDGIC